MVRLTPLFPHSAALLKTKREKILVVADLHVGFEYAMSEHGVNLPSQTHKLLRRLIELIEDVDPDVLLMLGDIKHGIPITLAPEYTEVPAFLNCLAKYVKVKLLLGNHDGGIYGLLPDNIDVLPTRGILIGDKIGLLHGHCWPFPALFSADYLIIGHNHPVIQVRDPSGFKLTRQVWVKAQFDIEKLLQIFLKYTGVKFKQPVMEAFISCFGVKPSRSIKLLIMPSFNDMLGGFPINTSDVNKESDDVITPLLRYNTVHPSKIELYLTDGTLIGTLETLRKLNEASFNQTYR